MFKILDFHPPKFLMTFLANDYKFRIFPLFSLFRYTYPPCFAKIIVSSLFSKISPLAFEKFKNLHLLFTYFMCIFVSPYFDHDAFMHHPMHVLVAPVNNKRIL